MAGPLHIHVIWILIGKDDLTLGAGQSLRPLALIQTAMHIQSLSDTFKDSPMWHSLSRH